MRPSGARAAAAAGSATAGALAAPGAPTEPSASGSHTRPPGPTAGSTVSSTPTMGLMPAALHAW